MAEEKNSYNESRGGQPGNEGQEGKGQSNPGGFDQQSSSSMEKEQQKDDRTREEQRQRSTEEN